MHKLFRAISIFVVISIILSSFSAVSVLAEESTVVSLADNSDSEKNGSIGDDINETTSSITVSATDSDEFRAVWIAFYDFKPSEYSNAEEFTAYIDEMFDNVVSWGMNAVFVHVRPFSDAMYPSEYFPWSKYASGKQGVDPGYDPLEIMVAEAHARNLEFHAWINPYRVTLSGTDVTKLAKDNPARKYLTNKKTSDDRNVLAYQGRLYYNPSKSAVVKLIVNGVKEIVQNYDVDGIHFDDYFYPDLGKSTYQTNFDAPEYEAYVANKQAQGLTYFSLSGWRRNNVNLLIKAVYSAIKEIDPDCVFGIAPAGAIDQLTEYWRNYVPYQTWMSQSGYIDYICPELYWSFNTLNTYPFYETAQRWVSALQNPEVKVYLGLPMYKMNTKRKLSSTNSLIDTEWYNQYTIKNMIEAGREIGSVSGFAFFDYEDLKDSRNKAAVANILKAWD